MTHTPLCKDCGARHYNFASCPGRRGTSRPTFNDGARPWGAEELPEGVLLRGAQPWKHGDTVKHLPRIPQDFGPKAA